MKPVSLDIDLLHLFVCNFASGRVFPSIQPAAHLQPFRSGRIGDEFDDRFVIAQRFTTPIRRDKREQPVLDLVPFAGAGRKMANGDGKPGLVREPLKFIFPQTQSPAVAPATVGRDQ